MVLCIMESLGICTHTSMDHVAIDIISDYIVVNIPYCCWSFQAKFQYQTEWITSLFTRASMIC